MRTRWPSDWIASLIASAMPYSIWNSYRRGGTFSRSATAIACAMLRTLCDPNAGISQSTFASRNSASFSKFASDCHFFVNTGTGQWFCAAITVS